MKKTFISKLTSFVLGAIIALGSISQTVYAAKKTPFGSEDSLRKKIIASASGKSGSSVYRNQRVMGNLERYIVTFKQSVSLSQIHSVISSYNYRLLADSDERVFLIYLKDKDRFFNSNKDIIQYMEEDKEKTLTAYIPNDTYANSYEIEMLNIPEAWSYGFGNEEIVIAILDSGIDRNHEDLKNANILPGMNYETGESVVNYDTEGHGTKVTGIIAATSDNGVGCSGIASGCTVLPLKITNAAGRIYTSDFIDSLYLAADSGADVINMSLGNYEYLESEATAIRYATQKGCILVAAAGNEGNHEEYAGMKCYPASYEGVISVGAVDETGKSCIFSQHNDSVDISAPGSGLKLLQSGGGYTEDSGTSFAAPFISAAAALSISELDNGVTMTGDQFDYLLSICAWGTKSNRTGDGIADIKKVLDYTNYPLVAGVREGGVYHDNVKITFNRGNATLDGEEFINGDLCKHSGEHVLIVTDGEKVTEIKFNTDNLPLTYTLKEGDGYSWLNIPFGSATLDGIPYKSGDIITDDGKHTLVITGLYGNEKTYTFNLSYAPPKIYGVEDGEIYNHPIRVSVATNGKIYLNGKEQKNEFTVYEEGQHTVLIKQNGNRKTTVNFTVSYNYNVMETAVTDAKCAYGAGIIAVWNALNEGVRLYDGENFKLLKYLYTGESIKDVYFGENNLYIAGQNTLFSAELSTLRETFTLQEILTFEFPLATADFDGNALYTVESSSVTSGTIKKISLDTLEQSDICFVRKIPDIISYDKLTDCVAFGQKDNTEIYVSPVSGETMKLFSPFESQKHGFVFKNGKIACGGDVFSVADSKKVFSSLDEKTLFFDGVTLITEKGIYNTESFETLGFHSMELSSVEYSDGKYFCAFDSISLYISENMPSAMFYGTTGTKTDREDFRKHVSLSKKFLKTLFLDGKVYASCDENKVYILDGETLEYISHFSLPFVPEGMETAGRYVFIYSKKLSMICMYDPSDEKTYFLETPDGIADLSVSANHISFIGDGNLYICDKSGNILLEDKSGDYISLTISQDGSRIYAIRYKSFYTVLTTYTLEALRKIHEVVLDYEASDIFCDNIYLYINTAVYYAANGEHAYSASSKIYGRTGSTFLTAQGLLINGKHIGYQDQSGNTFATSENGTLYVFDGTDLYITKCIYGNDYNIPSNVSGIENGVEYSNAVTVEFLWGKGYLDGEAIESGTVISDGGDHTFILILPFGLSYKYNFRLNASLSSLRIEGGDKAIKVNDSIKLSVNFLPYGSPTEEVMFYSENDILTVTRDGTVTALKEGTAKIYVATLDGRLVDSIKITVMSSMISFNSSYYKTDRTNGILYGVKAGTPVNSLLNALSDDIKENTKIIHENKEATGNVRTGMMIVLYGKKGDIIDSLTISVLGDCNGDGDVDIGDLAEAIGMLNRADTDPLIIKSADFSNNGIIDVADTFTYKEIILENEKNIPTANTQKPAFSGDAQLTCKENEDGTINLSISIKGKKAKGVSGKIKFDSEHLTFNSMERVGLISNAVEKDGYIYYLAILSEEKEGDVINLSFTAKENLKFSFSGEKMRFYSTTTEEAPVMSTFFEKKEPKEPFVLTPSAGTLTPEFSTDVFNYVLKIPKNVTDVEFFSNGENIPANGNKNLKNGSIITVIYNGVEYSFTVEKDHSDTFSTQNGKIGFPVWSAVLLSVLAVAGVLFVIFRKNIKVFPQKNQTPK